MQEEGKIFRKRGQILVENIIFIVLNGAVRICLSLRIKNRSSVLLSLSEIYGVRSIL